MQSDKNLNRKVLLSDFCNKSNKKVEYIRADDNLSSVLVQSKYIKHWDNLHYVGSLIKDIFLPKGYPHSVSSDYLEYQIWDTCQAFCSSISGTLTVQAIMKGIGVGSEAATPISAAITWIMKDGTGMIGSILFAWLKGSKLDSDCKKWRLFADILNDIAMFTELFIPMVIDYSMYLLCLATAFKALVGTAGSSTRAALITHQAIKGNIADVSAKDGSQELFTNLLAFVFGIIILKNITETHQVWSVMCTATLFHLIFNYKAVRCLRMDVFNGERFRLSLRSYLPTSSVPTIEQVNRRESVLLGGGTSDSQLCGFSIIFGAPLKKVIVSQKVSSQHLATLVATYQDQTYLILTHLQKKKIYVSFRTNFSDNDVLKAYFHAFLLGTAISLLQLNRSLHVIKRNRKDSPIYRLRNTLEGFIDDSLDSKGHKNSDAMMAKVMHVCKNLIDKEFYAFSKLCTDEGWNMNKHLINVDEWRADWEYISEKNVLPLKRSTMKRVSIVTKDIINPQPTQQEKKKRPSVVSPYSSLVIS